MYIPYVYMYIYMCIYIYIYWVILGGQVKGDSPRMHQPEDVSPYMYHPACIPGHCKTKKSKKNHRRLCR